MEQLNFDLNLAKIFIKVVECKSFSEASRLLHIPKSTVSRSVNQLEKSLGIPLILRTTRQLSLTHQGEKFFLESKKILQQFDATLAQILKSKEGTQGKIRITAPLDLGVTVLNPLIIEFSQQNPFIEFDVVYSDEIINLVREGFDLALRIGSQKDSQLKTKKISETSFLLAASPLFLQQNGSPHHFSQLEKMHYLHFGRISLKKIGRMSNGKDSFVLMNRPQITINHLESIKAMVLSSNGFALLPDFFIKTEIQKGTLVQVLKTFKTSPVPISWVMPEHKENSLVIKKFRDFVTPKLQNYN